MWTLRRGALAPKQVDKLKKLEQELSGYAPGNFVLRDPSRFTRVLRFLAILAIAVLLGALSALWPRLTSWRPAASSGPLAEELSTLQNDLAASEAARKELSKELE